MKKIFASALALLFLCIFQISILPTFTLFGAGANVIFLVVVWLGLNRTMTASLITASTGGVLLDLYSGLPFGTNALALSLIAVFLDILTHVAIPKTGSWQLSVLVLLPALLLFQMFLYGFSRTFLWFSGGISLALNDFIGGRIIWSAVYDYLLFAVIAVAGRYFFSLSIFHEQKSF